MRIKDIQPEALCDRRCDTPPALFEQAAAPAPAHLRSPRCGAGWPCSSRRSTSGGLAGCRPRDRGGGREPRRSSSGSSPSSPRTSRRRAILATNTSSLSIDAIGQLRRPPRARRRHALLQSGRQDAAGRGGRRQPAPRETAVRTATRFARRLGKTPVVVRDGPGFLVNRLLAFYSAEAMWLLDEGHRIEEIDRAMVDWGMPMGPLRLADEVGLDVSAKVGHILQRGISRPPALSRLARPARRGRGPARREDRQGDLSLRGPARAGARSRGLRPSSASRPAGPMPIAPRSPSA